MKPRVLILPGLNGGAELLADFTHALSATCRPRVIEYPPDPALDYAALLAHVRACLPRDEVFVVLAESFSGPLALRLAASAPPGMTHLVLCATFARAPRPALKFLRHALPWLPWPPARWLPDAALRWTLLDGANDEELLDRVRAVVQSLSSPLVKARLRQVLDVDARDALDAIALPTLYLQATRDRLVPARRGDELVAAIQGARIARLAGPHFLLQVAPGEAARAISDFLAVS